MINILERHWRRVAWFMASLLTAVLVSFGSNQIAPTTTSVSPNPVVSSLASTAFEEFAASHLAPNFYQYFDDW